MRTPMHGFVALLLVLAPAQAGIVVLKNGKVQVGNIPAETDTAEKLVMRWPTKTRDDRGEAEFLKADIRWYSRDHDEPTDEYFEKFENEPLADEYLGLREKWRTRRDQERQLKALSPSGDPSKESADMATTPDEKKAAAPVASATPEPAPAPTPAPATPAPSSSGGGLCSLGAGSDDLSPLALVLVAGALLVLRRRA